MININPSEQHEILEKCQVLREYSQFIDTVMKYQAMGIEEPYKKAIRECIEKGILADYLKRKGSEVVNMLTAEYDYETDIEIYLRSQQNMIELADFLTSGLLAR